MEYEQLIQADYTKGIFETRIGKKYGYFNINNGNAIPLSLILPGNTSTPTGILCVYQEPAIVVMFIMTSFSYWTAFRG